MMTTGPGWRALLLVLLAAAALAGCGDDDDADSGGAVADAAAQVADLKGAERAAELQKRAKAEGGSLQLYTSLEDDSAAAVVKAFERDTGLEVELFRAKSEQVLERTAKEARADVEGADVVESNAPGFVILAGDGAFAEYASPARAELIDESSHDDFWTASRLSLFTVSRNTKAVPDAERPRKVADLADPKWRDKVVMEADDYDWYITLRDHWVKSEGLSVEEADARFEAIARNARVVEGHSFMGELVAAGEFDLAASDYTHTATRTAGKGSPVAWAPPAEPLVGRANAVAISARARRPFGAMLFVDWLLGPGQEVLADQAIQPTRRDLYAELDAELVRVDEVGIVDRADEARDDYARITALAGKGPVEPED